MISVFTITVAKLEDVIWHQMRFFLHLIEEIEVVVSTRCERLMPPAVWMLTGNIVLILLALLGPGLCRPQRPWSAAGNSQSGHW